MNKKNQAVVDSTEGSTWGYNSHFPHMFPTSLKTRKENSNNTHNIV